jgi:hypothetical protein
MEQSNSWEANRSSAIQAIPPTLRSPKVHYHKHKSLSPVPSLSQINPVHGPPSHFLLTHFSYSDLYKLLTFHVSNFMSPFHCLGCTSWYIQPRGLCIRFITSPVFMMRICYHLAQPSSWRTTPCHCPRLLIQCIRSHTPYGRPFLHLQPEDAPCLVTGAHLHISWKVNKHWLIFKRGRVLLEFVAFSC